MSEKHGSLSINSENIFPIIKKWLYSDHDIFIRELISNGCDAITKLKKLSLMGEVELGDDENFSIIVKVDSDNKTISFTDNGIGMTDEEVSTYINQIAFSGAAEFLEKYKDKANSDQIIGHFGLGFYSAFMVADRVTIETLSYKDGAKPVFWESEGGTEYTMSEGDKESRGTCITLYLGEDSYEFSNEYRAREVIEKYCSFMPWPIYFGDPQFAASDFEEDDVKDVEVSEDGKASDANPSKVVPVNETNPLWNRHPNECKEEEYKDFYRKVFKDYKEPLFWIHLNMDYPFNLKGILYFPKINNEYDSIEGTIKLYNSQVFIADNIKEVIPEFLMLLKGVIDCPDLPLNVSRSALQNDGFVKKISDYITKKVADKLSGMCKVDRENYEKYWDDISPFIKFGCLKDDKFKEKMKDYIIYKNLEGKYLTLDEYLKANYPEDDEAATEGEDKESPKKKVFYVTDEVEQSQYINMFKAEGIDAVILTHNIDSPFISAVEAANEKVSFLRIDADLTESFKDDAEISKEEIKAIEDVFKKAINNDKLEIKVEKLKNADISGVITLSEEGRRMADMMKMYGMYGQDMSMFDTPKTLVLNANNELVKSIIAHPKAKNTALYCEQVYDLARIAQSQLKPDEFSKFIERSNKILMLLASK